MNPIECMSTEISVGNYLREYVDIPTFLKCCKACPNYGQKWSCPPYDFDVLQCWSRHKKLMLRGMRIDLLPEQKRQYDSADELNALLEETLWRQKDFLAGELALLERQHPGSIALSAGSCALCKSCTRPDGNPCRHPDKMRYSIESLGGNVEKTMRDLFGLELLWAKDGYPPAYWTLVAGLLV